MAHIGVSVDDQTKEGWAEHVEESEYGSMSELVRTAVRKEIRRGDGGEGVPRELEKELVELSEHQETITEAVKQLNDEFEKVEEATEAQYPEEIVELAMDIAEEDIQEIHADQFGDLEKDAQRDLVSLSRKHLDTVEIGKVAEALEYLEENLSYIKTEPRTVDDYWRVIGRSDYDR
jgi:Arc/MetJ-type ribon-helix-helix transcriptional regulator